jgi:hypothetical protein
MFRMQGAMTGRAIGYLFLSLMIGAAAPQDRSAMRQQQPDSPSLAAEPTPVEMPAPPASVQPMWTDELQASTLYSPTCDGQSPRDVGGPLPDDPAAVR